MSSTKKASDPRGGHVRLYWSIQDGPAWRALTHTEQALYVAMRRQLKGSNNGDVGATLATMRHFGFTSPTTLAKSLRALQTVGLIAKTRDVGGLTHRGALCCLYRFTDEACHAIPAKGVSASKASHEYLKWQSIAHASAEIGRAHVGAKRDDHPNKGRIKREPKLQLLDYSAPISGASQSSCWTVPTGTDTDSGLCQTDADRPQTLVLTGSEPLSIAATPSGRQAPENGLLYMLPPLSGTAATDRVRPATRGLMASLLLRARPPTRPPAYYDVRAGLDFPH